MRVTFRSQINPYLRNLENIQQNKHNNELKIATGQKLLTISDNPSDLVETKQIDNKLEKNITYLKNIDDSLSEMKLAYETIDYMSDTFQRIRDMSIESTLIGNQGGAPVLAQSIKGMLEDIIKKSNEDINGKYLFSGTKTLSSNSEIVPPATNNQPYEIIEVAKTTDNPSGLDVIFKGNNKPREINKDNLSTESINTTSDKLFGDNLETIQNVLKLYNILKYNHDGTERQKTDAITIDDFNKINEYQKSVAKNIERLNSVNAEFGSKITRFELYKSQYENTNIRLNEIKSFKSDTDIAKTTIDLKSEETALQYSLQIGSRLFKNSLFDFLG